MSLLTASEYRELVKPVRHKYHAHLCEYNGEKYSSKLEARYAATLDVWKAAGAVKAWFRQVSFVLHAKGGTPIGRYVCDFRVRYADGHEEFVECKGMDLALGKWKRAHCEAEYQLKIHLVRKI